MGLAKRLKKVTQETIETEPASPAAPVSPDAPEPPPIIQSHEVDEIFEFKTRVHRILIDRLDLSKLASVDRKDLEEDFSLEVARIIRELQPGISRGGEERLVSEVLNEVFGLGPIEPLLNDPTIEEIMVNNSKQVYCARFGKIFRSDTIFKDDDHLRQIIERIVSQVGRRIDEASPMVDARLLDGYHAHRGLPPRRRDARSTRRAFH